MAALGLLHEIGILHGDHRKENSIVVNRSVKWIDFLESCVANDPNSIKEKRIELITLMRSCYGGEVEESQCIEAAETYNGTAEGARAISTAFTEQSQEESKTQGIAPAQSTISGH